MDQNGKLEKPLEAQAFSEKVSSDFIGRGRRGHSVLPAHDPGSAPDRQAGRPGVSGKQKPPGAFPLSRRDRRALPRKLRRFGRFAEPVRQGQQFGGERAAALRDAQGARPAHRLPVPHGKRLRPGADFGVRLGRQPLFAGDHRHISQYRRRFLRDRDLILRVLKRQRFGGILIVISHQTEGLDFFNKTIGL